MSFSSSGQRAAERLMTLTLEAFAPGAAVRDADGMETDSYPSQGTCAGKVQGATAKDVVTRYVSIADVQVPVIDGGLHIPLSAFVSTSGVLQVVYGDRGTGWEFQVTGVGPFDDPALLGRRYLVVSLPAKSRATARRLDVVEVPAP